MNKNEIPENLKKAMENYAQAHADMDANERVQHARVKVAEAKGFLSDAETDLLAEEGPYRMLLGDIEEYIRGQVLELGRSIEHGIVEAKHRNGYERVTWTAKTMDSICLKNPAILELLAPARKVTEVAPNVKVRILDRIHPKAPDGYETE